MSVSIAEYLGQRTDVNNPIIEPVSFDNQEENHLCPFTNGNPCKKIKSRKEPVCSLRENNNTLWINCPDRLCATKKNLPLCDHQANILYDIAKNLFSQNIRREQICVKREVQLSVIQGTKYKADYIMTLEGGRSPYPGPDRVILEMQGGGESSETGKITRHIHEWRGNEIRTNIFLRQQTNANTLETNAWRRQQEQFIVKGNIAMQTWKGYGMAFCVGTLLYDYIMNKLRNNYLPDLHQNNWTLALIGIKEQEVNEPQQGPIPLCVDRNRMLFTNYQTFVQALINQGVPSPNAFKGNFINLNNEPITINNN